MYPFEDAYDPVAGFNPGTGSTPGAGFAPGTGRGSETVSHTGSGSEDRGGSRAAAVARRRIELLAPARDLACGLAALEHGADAVYIGADRFGARKAAGNSMEDIAQLCRRAHLFGARVYLALNTLLDDNELGPARATAWEAYEAGVDAIIIQDTGLLLMDLPPVEIHGSTQMDIRSPEKAAFLASRGLSQLVLARELSLAEIRSVRAACGASLEFFVHGALCVSYSGRCRISEVMAGRSADRGECAQFCRHGYSLEDASGKQLHNEAHLLSMGDLNLLARLGDLIDAGIDSFKIEGRLKDRNYVVNVTSAYRLALDRILQTRPELERGSGGDLSFAFDPDLNKSFARPFTGYFLDGGKRKPAAIHSPKSLGEELGRVKTVTRRSITLDEPVIVANGDGLCWIDSRGRTSGARVNSTGPGGFVLDSDAMPAAGTLLFRNHDHAYERMMERERTQRSIALSMEIHADSRTVSCRIQDRDGLESRTVAEHSNARSNNPGSSRILAERQMRKTGGTPFHIEALSVELPDELHLELSALNNLRRRALEAHAGTRVSFFASRRRLRAARTNLCGPAGLPSWPVDAPDGQPHVRNKLAQEFFRRALAGHPDTPAPAGDRESDALMTSRYCIRFQLGMCDPARSGELYLRDRSQRYRLEFDCGKCEMKLFRAD